MIRQVRIKRFKRFQDETIDLPGNVVLAGPNNTGKTAALQAIATWDFAHRRWKELNEPQKHRGSFAKQPIARRDFLFVPFRTFDPLFHDRNLDVPIEIGVRHAQGWDVAMEIIPDTSEQVFVRPTAASFDPFRVQLSVVYVPPMYGIGTDEPVYRRAKQDHLLGQGRGGDILRNLVAEVAKSESWPALKGQIQELFGYELLLPNIDGPHIIAEFRAAADQKPLDIASAGSGLRQVLMLLSFLYTRPSSIMLLDEPDAHLHVILQDSIYSLLKALAVERRTQLIVATHSQVIINSARPDELYMFRGDPDSSQPPWSRPS